MIQSYESGDMIVVDSNTQVWLVCHRFDGQTYLVQNRQGHRIRLHTERNESRIARPEELEAGRKIESVP
jgi:ribosomal protein L21E